MKFRKINGDTFVKSDNETLKFIITSYAFLLPFNGLFSLYELAIAIGENYSLESKRNRYCVKYLLKYRML